MDLHAALLGFVGWGLYPAWLIAGACDYFAHRRTDIAHTSRAAESWLHVAELLSVAAVLVPAALFAVTRGVWIWMLGAVLVHSVLAYVDVAYTDGRRYISPFEQTAHCFLHALPPVAVALLGVAYWPQIVAGGWELIANDIDTRVRSALLLSLAILGGIPVTEELIRTLRVRPAHIGLATIR
jgi:hypothetical protein